MANYKLVAPKFPLLIPKIRTKKSGYFPWGRSPKTISLIKCEYVPGTRVKQSNEKDYQVNQ